MNEPLFLRKLVYIYGSTFKFLAAHPYQDQTWEPPPGGKYQVVIKDQEDNTTV